MYKFIENIMNYKNTRVLLNFTIHKYIDKSKFENAPLSHDYNFKTSFFHLQLFFQFFLHNIFYKNYFIMILYTDNNIFDLIKN